MGAMLRWLFKPKNKKVDLDQIRSERWETTFGSFQEKRFIREEGDGYAVVPEDRSMKMEITRSRLFAWTINPWFQYRDCLVDADLEFGAQNASSAVGLVFRYTNDENYYYCMVSRSGRFRFDVVFNGTPIPLVPWLELPQSLPDRFNFQVIAHGQHFSFYLDKEWIAEVADDHLEAGRIGWAGQNYGDRPLAEFRLHRFAVESRAVEVEAQFLRWTGYVEVEPSQRRVLARTFFSFGKFVEAQLQMRRALADSPATLEDLFFLVQCAIRQEFYDDAMRLNLQILDRDPQWELALREKANILYLQSRYLELRDYLKSLMERFPEDEVLWNLLGHALTGLGRFQEALQAYKQASELNPRMPLFLFNAGLSSERLRNNHAAVQYFLQAGTEFFRQEAWTDVGETLARLEALGASAQIEVQALKGKFLFQQGDRHQARHLLKKALDAGSADSAVHFLFGLILKEEGSLAEALASVDRASTLEPEFYLYHFKAAELRHQLGQASFQDSLQRAMELEPSNPWILNFKGLTGADQAERLFYLEKAHLAAPAEKDISLNLSDLYHRLGRREEAFKLLAGFEDSAPVFNHRGNLFSRENRFDEALVEYEKALQLDPTNPDYMENAAACALELEMFLRSEELLLDLLEIRPTVKAYTALGNLMRQVGDFVRSEVALRTALETDPVYRPAQIELGYLYLTRQKFPLVQAILKDLRPVLKGDSTHPDTAAARELEAVFRRQTMEKIHCADCGRLWWVPRVLPPQSALKVHGEIPDQAPAGRSPATGKVYCVGCAQKHMKDGRFLCPDSGEFLQLKEDQLKYLFRSVLDEPLGSS